jgi:enoyl-CoA hydratase
MRTQGALHLRRQGAVLEVRFTRPDRLNAVTADGLDDLADLLDEVAEDASVRVVVLSGEGRAFCSGADLDYEAVPSEGPGTEAILAANRVVRALRSMPQPTVAAVNGPAAGVGCSLALGCDLVLAAESAYFTLAFTNIGLMPDGGATALVPASLGRSRALQMALVPDKVTAETAREWGIVHRVVPADRLGEAVAELTERLVAGAPRAYAATKRAINAATLGGLEASMQLEVDGQADLLKRHDFREAVTAFAEKRRPVFTGT